MKENIVIKLDYPIPAKIAGTEEDVSELVFGRLKAKHFKYFPKEMLNPEEGAADKKYDPQEILPIVAGLTGLSEEAIGEIDLEEDFEKVMQGFTDFFEGHQSSVTGKN